MLAAILVRRSSRAGGRAASAASPGMAEALAAVDDLFKQFVADRHVPGAAWGVRVPDGGLHTGVTGFRDVPSKAPVTADSVFRIASMTKSFTAISILKLRDEGKLSLDDPAEKLRAGDGRDEVSDSRRAEDHDPSPPVARRGLSPKTTRGAIVSSPTPTSSSRRCCATGIPFSNAPGLVYEYSNLGFAILGRIVTNVSKMPYEDYVSANILTPLAMRRRRSSRRKSRRIAWSTATVGKTSGGRTSRCWPTVRSDPWVGC